MTFQLSLTLYGMYPIFHLVHMYLVNIHYATDLLFVRTVLVNVAVGIDHS